MTGHKIRFECRRYDDHGSLEVVPYIDGSPLTDLIDRFETGAGMHPAGDAYGGLVPQFFRFGPMEDHFLGRSAGTAGPKSPLLGCNCGEWGCWPLMADITVTSALVTWDSFEQPHRRERDYSGFGPFQFDRPQYDGALKDLSAALNSGDS
ncbi:hypothetical protein [Streptomyces aureus]|uniref:hypothetical protein n=1 Tax=Streptomyces aureus TaxID=193461 RepID=UPI0033C8584E